MSDEPEQLGGGNMGFVVRIGDTVLRDSGEWTSAVHRLLSHLDAAGVRGVPKPLGITEDRREVLSFVEGAVPTYPIPRWVWAETALESSARLLRQVHDATAGVDVPGSWRSAARRPAEVICHNDFAVYNLVFDGELVVGAIDRDFASPAPRLWDVAYLAYRISPLSSGDRRDGFTDEQRRRRLERLLDAYGSDHNPRDVMTLLHERLLALAALSDEMARRPGKQQLNEDAIELTGRHERPLPQPKRCFRMSLPGPVRSSAAPLRPAIAVNTASPGPRASGRLPSAQSTSVATTRTPRAFQAPRNGGAVRVNPRAKTAAGQDRQSWARSRAGECPAGA